MKSLFFLGLLLFSSAAYSQNRENPIIKGYGGIYPVPDAVERPDPEMEYKMVIDLASGSQQPGEINQGLVNIARMINLHSIGGVSKDKLSIVVAVHNEASYSIMDNDSYRQRFKTDNPNLDLYSELSKAGVKIFICGQSIMARNIDRGKITEHAGIATSMLTVLSTYQLKGYAWFKF